MIAIRRLPWPPSDVTKFLRASDNAIAVGVHNGYATGGLDPHVMLDVVRQSTRVEWSRSLFNGLAQIIVQSTRPAGEIRLTASADGLAGATTVVHTQPGMPRPDVP